MEKVNDLFLRATKEKFRFPYMGQISTEDLWDLSIENLDSIYGKLDEDLARLTTKTLIKDKKTNIEKELEDKIEIVKFIVEFKQAEIEAAKEKAMKSVKKQKILALIHEKENETFNSSYDVSCAEHKRSFGMRQQFRQHRFKRKSRQLKHYGLGRNLVGGDVSRLHQRDRN